MINKQYITTSGDMWDSIAYKVMGNEAYTDKLIQSNLQHRHIVIFPADVVLDIPDTIIKVASDLPPWKRGDNG